MIVELLHSGQEVKSVSEEYGLNGSMSRKGNCWDNAVAESFFKSIKYKWINRFSFKSTSQLEMAI